MAVEKRNPLPIGSYLVVAPGDDKIRTFSDWLRRNSSNIAVVNTSPIGGAEPPSRWWYFHTKQPVLWEGPGYPDIATEAMLKEYGQIPSENPYWTAVKDTAGDVKEAAKVGIGGLAAVAVAALLAVYLIKRD